MVEQIVNDGLGNVLTLKYDELTDTVYVKNSNIHDNFLRIYLNDDSDVVEDVITIEDMNGPNQWNNYTDNFGRSEMHLFWAEHKIDKVTRGLS